MDIRRNPEIPDEFLNMALGRLFAMGSRPTQPGDVEMYEKIRSIFMEAFDNQLPEYFPNYAMDRNKGAQGD